MSVFSFKISRYVYIGPYVCLIILYCFHALLIRETLEFRGIDFLFVIQKKKVLIKVSVYLERQTYSTSLRCSHKLRKTTVIQN